MEPTRQRRTGTQTIRHALTMLGAAIIVAAIALPAIGASPSPSVDPSVDPIASASPSPSASASPSPTPSVSPSPSASASLSPKPSFSPSPSPSPKPSVSPSPTTSPDVAPASPGDGQDKAKGDEVDVVLRGTVSAVTDEDGRTTYRLTSAGTVYELEVGPPWFWGADHPLKPYIGKTVTITGEQRAGTTEIDVLQVDGKAIREPGRPPWAGGWRHVGSSHPGWSQEKADRFAAKFGDCFPPGQCKKQNAGADDPDD